MKKVKLSIAGTLLIGVSVIGTNSFYGKISKYKIEPWRMMNTQPWEKNKKKQKRKKQR